MNLLDLEDEKLKNVNINGKNFKIRFISPRDRISIAQKRASFQGGLPFESFPEQDLILFDNIAVVDICTEEFPTGINSSESCGNWDDGELINNLANEIRKHTADFEAKLKKNRPLA